MLLNIILNKLSLPYDGIAKKKHGNSPSITYGEVFRRILDDKGSRACKYVFSEYGEQTFNRMMRKIFPSLRLNGGNQTWYFYLLSVAEYKHCGSCSEEKEFSAFSRDTNNNSLGLNSTCKSCVAKEQEGQYARYHEAHTRSYEKNYGKIRARSQYYKLERAKRIPSWSEIHQIAEFYENCPKGYHVDHIIPLKGKLVSGLHVLSNLQYLTIEDNLKKNNHFEIT